MDCRPAFIIRNRRGATLVEVMAAVVITGTVMAGIAVAYVFGLDSWNKTVGRVGLQQNGTYALQELEKELQRAGGIAISGDAMILSPSSYDTLSKVTFRLSGKKLYRTDAAGEHQVIPFAQNDKVLTVEKIRWTAPTTVSLRYTFRGYVDEMEFTTDVFGRNAPVVTETP